MIQLTTPNGIKVYVNPYHIKQVLSVDDVTLIFYQDSTTQEVKEPIDYVVMQIDNVVF